MSTLTSQRQKVLVMGQRLADSWDATKHLTCAEVDSIAGVLMQWDFVELASQVILGHAQGDSDAEFDVHYSIHAESDPAEKQRLATNYVEWMP